MSNHPFDAWCTQHNMHPHDCWSIHNPEASNTKGSMAREEVIADVALRHIAGGGDAHNNISET